MFIYLDESGDLGFDFTKAKTTRKFIISLLVCMDKQAYRAQEKAIRRTLKKLNHKKHKSRIVEELKGTKTTLKIKKYFLKQIKNDNWGIYTIALNKERVQSDLQQKRAKPRLYNYLAKHIIEKLPLDDSQTNVRLIVDRSKNKSEVRDFNQYVETYITGHLDLNAGLKIEHLPSNESKGLQAADLFCWGMFRKYEYEDCKWYDCFYNNIKYETEYLPKMRN